MEITPMRIPEVLLIKPRVFSDDRGCFLEVYRLDCFLDRGISSRFVQDNVSFSGRNVLRGLHYQLGQPQGKLIMVMQGEIFDVAVDIRRGSPNFGQWVSAVISSENHHQLYVPEGFAHGFCVMSNTATVLYKCTEFYAPMEERGIRWDDPLLAIDWPTATPVLSDKDSVYPILSGLLSESLPLFRKSQ